jgi:hypothetical protein
MDGMLYKSSRKYIRAAVIQSQKVKAARATAMDPKETIIP